MVWKITSQVSEKHNSETEGLRQMLRGLYTRSLITSSPDGVRLCTSSHVISLIFALSLHVRLCGDAQDDVA